MWRLTAGCLLAMIAVSASFAADDADKTMPLTADEFVAVADAGRIGSALFRHDRAAWIATDELQKKRSIRRDKRVRGWVTEDIADGIRVTLIGAVDATETRALYRIDIPDQGKPGKRIILDPPVALSPYERDAFRARSLAIDMLVSGKLEACSTNYNTVVLPKGISDTAWSVYLMPPLRDADLIPLGGAYRITVDPDHPDALASRGYTRSCIGLSKDKDAVAAVVSHILDPNPTEIHVFWSILTETPMWVVTVDGGGLWYVRGPNITKYRRDEPTEDASGQPTDGDTGPAAETPG